MFAKQQGVEGFDEQQGGDDTEQADNHEERQLLQSDTAEVAKSPHHVTLNTGIGGEEVEQRNGGVGDVAYHDADDK